MNEEQLTSFSIFVDAIDYQVLPVRCPNHSAKVAHSFRFWEFDLERHFAAAVGGNYIKLLFGPASARSASGNEFAEKIRHDELPLLRGIRDDVGEHLATFIRSYVSNRNEVLLICFAGQLNESRIRDVKNEHVSVLRK